MAALPSFDLKQIARPVKTYSTAFLVFSAVALQAVASLCYPISKYGLGFIEPFTFAFFRYLLSSTVLLLIVKLRKYEVPVERKDFPKIFLIGFIIIIFNQTLFVVGQAMTAAGHGAFIFSTTPVLIFFLAMIHRKEKFSWRRAVGSVLAFVGVLIIISSGAIEISTRYLIGDVIIILSVTAWAYYTILGRDLVRKYGALRMTAYALSFGSAVYFPFGLFMALKFDYSQATPAAWGAVVYMALGLSVFVYVMWYWLLKYMEASRVAVFHNIQPVIATVVAYFFLGETLTLPFLFGGAVVLAGVITSES